MNYIISLAADHAIVTSATVHPQSFRLYVPNDGPPTVGPVPEGKHPSIAVLTAMCYDLLLSEAPLGIYAFTDEDWLTGPAEFAPTECLEHLTGVLAYYEGEEVRTR